ncbi:MAG: PadR family transcriptional regulator [Anaerolineales bacterium]
MAAPAYRSCSPEFALLGLLYLQPGHGYDLHRRLTAELGAIWRVSQSQTYNILKRLQSQGYLTSRQVAQEKLPALQALEITPAGRARFEAWLAAPSGGSVRAVRLDFLTRLYFARQLDAARLPAMTAGQIERLNQTIARLESARAGLPPGDEINRLSLELRIRQLRSALAWLEECAATFAPIAGAEHIPSSGDDPL